MATGPWTGIQVHVEKEPYPTGKGYDMHFRLRPRTPSGGVRGVAGVERLAFDT